MQAAWSPPADEEVVVTEPEQNGNRVGDYEIRAQVGEGTYGAVYMAYTRHGREAVALKRVLYANKRQEEEGFPTQALREIRILRKLIHPNIVTLRDVVFSEKVAEQRGDVYLVFDFYHFDLAGLVYGQKHRFKPEEVKCMMMQMLDALDYCHLVEVLHRDLKLANMMLTKAGDLKLGDFGLARTCKVMDPSKPMCLTNRVITLWYRPPEILLGATDYRSAVDVWGAGCIIAELHNGQPLFTADGPSPQAEVELLRVIFRKLGNLPALSAEIVEYLEDHFPKWEDFKSELGTTLAQRAPELDTCSVVPEMVTVIPERRITAKAARCHAFFNTEKPFRCLPREIQLPDRQCHDYSVQQRRKAETRDASKHRSSNSKEGLEERLAGRQRPRARRARETPLTSASPLATPLDERDERKRRRR